MINKTKTITIPIYDQVLRIVVTEDLAKPEFDAYVELFDDKIIVYLKPNTSAGTIAHEVIHIANFVFKNCYITLDIDNDEPYAYLIGYLVDQIHKFLQKTNKELAVVQNKTTTNPLNKRCLII